MCDVKLFIFTVISVDWLYRTYVSGKGFATDYTEIGIDSGKGFATDYVNFSGYKIPNLSRF
jgi:hypothetical protein